MIWGENPPFLETPIWIGVSTSPFSQGQRRWAHHLIGVHRRRGTPAWRSQSFGHLARLLGSRKNTTRKIAVVKDMEHLSYVFVAMPMSIYVHMYM